MIMPSINVIAVIVAALIPNIIGAIYYGPLFGKVWRQSLNKTEEELQPNNPAVTYGTALFLGAILSFFLNFTIQLVHKDVNAAGELIINSHNTFGHGALHGAAIAMTIVMPILVSLGLFHKTNWKTTILNVGFWLVCMMLMGGILDIWH